MTSLTQRVGASGDSLLRIDLCIGQRAAPRGFCTHVEVAFQATVVGLIQSLRRR